MRVLGQQAQRIAHGQHGLEDLARLLLAPHACQGVDAPEGADVERGLGLAEVVGGLVAAHEGAIAQHLFHHVQRAHEALVARVDQADFGHQEDAGIQLAPAKALGEYAALGVPRAREDLVAHALRVAAPVLGALGQLQGARYFCQPVARRPAHQRRRGVDACARAQLPHAGVRRAVDLHRQLADALQPRELGRAGGLQQALVVKGLRGAQHDVAVHVVLEVLGRLIAHAHRTHAAVALHGRYEGLRQFVLQPDAVQGLDVAVAGFQHDVGQPAQVVLHGADFGQAVERAHDEERIAQPAVAVVPVAPAVCRFGNAGGHRGDDGAGVFE